MFAMCVIVGIGVVLRSGSFSLSGLGALMKLDTSAHAELDTLKSKLAAANDEIARITNQRDQLASQVRTSVPLTSIPRPWRADDVDGTVLKLARASEDAPTQRDRIQEYLRRLENFVSNKHALRVSKANWATHEEAEMAGMIGALLEQLGVLPTTEGLTPPVLTKAVSDFQARHGLKSDALVGKNTLLAIRKAIEAQISS